MSGDRPQFPESFLLLTGYPPMKWQHRLFRRFAEGDSPAALDLPTGLGKTSVMAIWLIALAAAKEEARKALPRRLVYVVDRQAVVDQATEEAERLRRALDGEGDHLNRMEPGARAHAIRSLAELKRRLGFEMSDHGERKRPLPISTLRGQYVDNREWLDDPAAAAIIVGTIDMIGSRLLFEGYGVTRKMRPYQAGLLGADALIVLDEAHLAPPFEALTRSIAEDVSQFGPRIDGGKIVPTLRLMSLSATGRSRKLRADAEETGFRLEEEDLSDPIVKERLDAKKTLTCIEIGGGKDALVEELARQAWKLSREGGEPIRCLVYCESRDIANGVKKKIDNLAGVDKPELFVGARRVKERDRAKAWLKDHGFLAGSEPPVRPAFLIATSAGEVGVDLDADHMVCDLAPWERMVQRFGRVNRRGRGDASVVVVHAGEPKPKKPESPTDQEQRQIVGFRSLSVIEMLPATDGGRSASPGALRALKLRAQNDKTLADTIDAAMTPEPLRPALTRALVDAWSMTSLERHTGRPEIAPWLRGWVENDPQTTVIWRVHLPVREDVPRWPRKPVEKKEVEEFFEAAPPHRSEKLETETYRVVDWLQDRAKILVKRGPPAAETRPEGDENGSEIAEADGGDETQPPMQTKSLAKEDIVAFALSDDGGYAAGYPLSDLAMERKGRAKDEFHDQLAGKILVVDARFGGLDEDGMLDANQNRDCSTADANADWSEQAGFRVWRLRQREGREDEKLRDPDWRFEDKFVVRQNDDGDPTEWLVIQHFRGAAQSEKGRSISYPQLLVAHQSGAERKALEIAANIGLSGFSAETLALAAAVHDEGKRSWRWQQAFKAQRDAKKYGLSGPLAKTHGPPGPLDGYRHEFGSLAIFEPEHVSARRLPAEVRKRIDGLPEDWRKLLLHLIAAHHGFGRPVIATSGCEDAPPSALEERARNVALRFARLQKLWGPWGLAWWEALLRAADQQASRDNDAREYASASQMESA